MPPLMEAFLFDRKSTSTIGRWCFLRYELEKFR
jgi:hypothetical protein